MYPPTYSYFCCLGCTFALYGSIMTDLLAVPHIVWCLMFLAGQELEAAWHVRHKRAAQRLAGYCRDLPAAPPLQPLLHAASCCSIAAGLAVDGQALSGLLAPGTAGGWLGSNSSSSSGTPQLLLSCAVHEPTDGSSSAAAKVQQHEAAGLSRKQLLELFTGSGDEAAAQAPAAATAAATEAARDVSTINAADLAAGGKAACRRKNISDSSVTVASSADMTVHVLDDAQGHAEAAAAAAASEMQQQIQLAGRQASLLAAPSAAGDVLHVARSCAAAGVGDPLSFLEGLPLYGQQDHAQLAAALLDGSGSSSKQQRRLQLLDTLQLSLRAVYLLLVFAPFMLLGVPMLLLSWYLLSRAAAAQQQSGAEQQPKQQQQGTTQLGSSNGAAAVTVISPLPVDDSSCSDSLGGTTSWRAAVSGGCSAAKDALSHPRALLAALLRQLLLLLMRIAALLDLLLVLLLGGHWAAGIGAWESAGLFLRRCAWRLLLFSSSAAGAAFIKWGQWSSARRDIFPEDFCDTLAALHDK